MFRFAWLSHDSAALRSAALTCAPEDGGETASGGGFVPVNSHTFADRATTGAKRSTSRELLRTSGRLALGLAPAVAVCLRRRLVAGQVKQVDHADDARDGARRRGQLIDLVLVRKLAAEVDDTLLDADVDPVLGGLGVAEHLALHLRLQRRVVELA